MIAAERFCNHAMQTNQLGILSDPLGGVVSDGRFGDGAFPTSCRASSAIAWALVLPINSPFKGRHETLRSPVSWILGLW